MSSRSQVMPRTIVKPGYNEPAYNEYLDIMNLTPVSKLEFYTKFVIPPYYKDRLFFLGLAYAIQYMKVLINLPYYLSVITLSKIP